MGTLGCGGHCAIEPPTGAPLCTPGGYGTASERNVVSGRYSDEVWESQGDDALHEVESSPRAFSGTSTRAAGLAPSPSRNGTSATACCSSLLNTCWPNLARAEHAEIARPGAVCAMLGRPTNAVRPPSPSLHVSLGRSAALRRNPTGYPCASYALLSHVCGTAAGIGSAWAIGGSASTPAGDCTPFCKLKGSRTPSATHVRSACASAGCSRGVGTAELRGTGDNEAARMGTSVRDPPWYYSH